MKKLLTLFILILSFNCFATEVTCTYDNGWKRMIVDLEEKVMKLQVWKFSDDDFRDSLIVKDVNIEVKEGHVVIYDGPEKSQIMGEIVHLKDRKVKLSTVLYKNKWFETETHENLEDIFEL